MCAGQTLIHNFYVTTATQHYSIKSERNSVNTAAKLVHSYCIACIQYMYTYLPIFVCSYLKISKWAFYKNIILLRIGYYYLFCHIKLESPAEKYGYCNNNASLNLFY